MAFAVFFKRLFAFLWSCVLSLLALFRRSNVQRHRPFPLPAHRDALARTRTRLRPTLTARTQSTARHDDVNPGPSSSPPPPQSGPERTDPTDQAPREGTPDTSLPTTNTASLSVPPLTPPDRCYLAPAPSVTDCPYAEPWPANAPVSDRNNKLRLPASPLRASMHYNLGPIGSPPPKRRSPPIQVWTSTPCKIDGYPQLPGPAISPFDDPSRSHSNASSLEPLARVSRALLARSRHSVIPAYDDASRSSTSPSDASFSVDSASLRLRARSFPRLDRHSSDGGLYAFAWRRHDTTRLPGKFSRNSLAQPRLSLPLPRHRPNARVDPNSNLASVTEWYDSDVYLSSPVPALSPPQAECGMDDSDDAEPLGRLRERLVRRSAVLSVVIADTDADKPFGEDWFEESLVRSFANPKDEDALAPVSQVG